MIDEPCQGEKKLSGCYGSKIFRHRIIGLGNQEGMRTRDFCEKYGISRWVVYNLLKRHVLCGNRKGHVWRVAIREGGELAFEFYLFAYRNHRKPRKGGNSEYSLGFPRD